MGSGLLQLVSTGSMDLFLTGASQITFFKIVYKKYTNFAIENIIIPLDGNANFDQKTTTILPKVGDLIHKMYLQVTIPMVNIINNDKYIDPNAVASLNNQLNLYNAQIPKYNNFYKYNFIILNGLKLEIKTIGCTWYTVSSLMTNYNTQYASSISSIGLNIIDVLTKFNSEFPSSLPYTGSTSNINLLITDITKFIDDMTEYYKGTEKELYLKIKSLKDGITNINTKNEYFAWTDKLGNNLIKKCSISIGGSEITSFDSDYLNIYNSLNGDYKQREHLDRMIGTIPALTNYDNLQKPQTKLYIPLPYWFTLHNGNVLPLISLIYHDIEFTIEFNSLDNCCFYNGTQNLNNLMQLGDCNLFIDYIYMDSDERKKFAQFAHEYLVQTVQINTSNISNTSSYSIDMGFQHPVKELYWIIKENNIAKKYKLINKYYPIQIYNISNISPDNGLVKITFSKQTNDIFVEEPFINNKINLKYTKYYDGVYDVTSSLPNSVTIKIKYIENVDYNDGFYGIIYNESKSGYFNPIDTEFILFNGQYRTPLLESTYFNYVVPYQYYTATPLDGINAYSFSLHPKEYQPSGSCNFSLLKSQTLNINLNKNYYNYILTNDLNYELSIYAINYNVLRINNGIAGLIFSG